MSLTSEQLEAATEYMSILDGIARRLLLEGKIRIEKGKIVFLDQEKKQT